MTATPDHAPRRTAPPVAEKLGVVRRCSRLVKTTLLIACLSALALSSCAGSADLPSQAQPNTKLAKPLGRWPTAGDIKRLESVKGLTAAKVLRTLGHPKHVERQEDGQERWDYPWRAAACVYFRDGVATGTFYTAGY
jgi:outer membrane protein assembly factor BamE (lipoprotein component of BamABCDE complex)